MAEDATVLLLKALADETRLKIVRQLARCDGSESCRAVSQLSALSQPAMSHHFNKLAEAGVIFEEKEGKEKFYKLNRQLLKTSGLDPELL